MPTEQSIISSLKKKHIWKLWNFVLEYICPNENIVSNYQTVVLGMSDSKYNTWTLARGRLERSGPPEVEILPIF